MAHLCYISIGSNLGDRLSNCQVAIDYISDFSLIKRRSSFYETEPWGYKDCYKYINMVVSIETLLGPYELIDQLQLIEKKMGRLNQDSDLKIYQARVIDLDILFYDSVVLKSPKLTIPHPNLYQRQFVLIPFAEINPDFICPLSNKKIIDIMIDSPDQGKVEPYAH